MRLETSICLLEKDSGYRPNFKTDFGNIPVSSFENFDSEKEYIGYIEFSGIFFGLKPTGSFVVADEIYAIGDGLKLPKSAGSGKSA